MAVPAVDTPQANPYNGSVHRGGAESQGCLGAPFLRHKFRPEQELDTVNEAYISAEAGAAQARARIYEADEQPGRPPGAGRAPVQGPQAAQHRQRAEGAALIGAPPPGGAVRLRFPRTRRLTHGAEIERVRRGGRYWAVGPVVLYALQAAQPETPTRSTAIAGKKIGNAIARNRAKRWIREAFRAQLPYIKKGWELVWIARPSMQTSDFGRVQAAVAECLKRAQLYENSGIVGNPPVSEDA
jgi:ribonuclease P protein component